MSYLALARKWRPKRFDQIVGQTHVVQSLTHALTQDKIHHAYLFTGTHGVGKTTLARIFAKCVNCEKGVSAEPCEQCSHCLEIDSGRFPDLYEIDAASRTKVEDTRELLDNIPYAPSKGRYKVYLIDEVHMLSGHSFNALLKTLEEPPAHVKFLLATTDPQKLPATVLSRCLQFHLSKITCEQIVEQLSFILKAENIPFEPEALKSIAQSSHGSMRDSLSLLDQCIAYCNGSITTSQTQAMLGLSNATDMDRLLQAISQQDASTALSITESWEKMGVNFSRCLSDLLTHLHQLSTKQLTDPAFSCAFSKETVQLYYQIALVGQRDLPLAPTPQIGFEMIVMRMMAFALEPKTITLEPKTTSKFQPSPIEKPSVRSSSDWHTLLPQLKLSGPTLALAQHCSIKSHTETTIHLIVDPKYAALLNPKQEQRIQDAFKTQLDCDKKVKITTEKNNMETPAQSAVRLQDEKKQSAKQAISKDPAVKRIVNQFNATVIEESIEPNL